MSRERAHWRIERNIRIRSKIFGLDRVEVPDYQMVVTKTANSITGTKRMAVHSGSFMDGKTST